MSNFISTTLVSKVVIPSIFCIANICNGLPEYGIDGINYFLKVQSELTNDQKSVVNISSTTYNTYTTIINGDKSMSDEWINLYNRNLNKLYLMYRLDYNWDDNGAKPFSAELLDKIKVLIGNLRELQPDVYPKTDSRVQLEFYTEYNRFLKIVISENSFDVYATDGINFEDDFFERFDYDENTIIKIVNRFYNNKLVGKNG